MSQPEGNYQPPEDISIESRRKLTISGAAGMALIFTIAVEEMWRHRRQADRPDTTPETPSDNS